MTKFTYKIYIPFQYGVGNKFYNTQLTTREFTIDGIDMILNLDESHIVEKCFIQATTFVNEIEGVELIDVADMKVGSAVQSFFDGLSKGLNNAAFFDVFNGDEFYVNYDVSCNGSTVKNKNGQRNHGYSIDDNLVGKALLYATKKEPFMKQAFLYLNEGEYFVDVGRFSSAIIHYAIMVEYLVNHLLRTRSMLDGGDKLKGSSQKECSDEYIATGKSGKPSFSYQKYFFGLNKIGYPIQDDLLEAVDEVYRLRNKIAHGYNILEAFSRTSIKFGDDNINEYNLFDYMARLADEMTGIYNFFSDILE